MDIIGLKEGVTDEGLRALAEKGCGPKLKSLCLSCEWFPASRSGFFQCVWNVCVAFTGTSFCDCDECSFVSWSDR